MILASASPRRREILGRFNLPVEIMRPTFNERSIPFTGDPKQYAIDIAKGKSHSIRRNDAIVITSDTVVFKDEKIYGKPSDPNHALEMLLELQDGWHTVCTAISVRRGDHIESDVAETRVHILPLNEEQIRKYHAAIEPLDKAGAYAIQGAGALIIDRIEGCFYNVMGLPITHLQNLLTQFGASLWDGLSY